MPGVILLVAGTVEIVTIAKRINCGRTVPGPDVNTALSFERSFADGPAWFDLIYEKRGGIEKAVVGLQWEKRSDNQVVI